ncbi:hypothetical protein EDD85DRAFT_796107 [Armillaria nabsnona]|nr:hypothetical protein EDD85DRAFT_796107 [Armillaria nabsnona]
MFVTWTHRGIKGVYGELSLVAGLVPSDLVFVVTWLRVLVQGFRDCVLQSIICHHGFAFSAINIGDEEKEKDEAYRRGRDPSTWGLSGLPIGGRYTVYAGKHMKAQYPMSRPLSRMSNPAATRISHNPMFLVHVPAQEFPPAIEGSSSSVVSVVCSSPAFSLSPIGPSLVWEVRTRLALFTVLLPVYELRVCPRASYEKGSRAIGTIQTLPHHVHFREQQGPFNFFLVEDRMELLQRKHSSSDGLFFVSSLSSGSLAGKANVRYQQLDVSFLLLAEDQTHGCPPRWSIIDSAARRSLHLHTEQIPPLTHNS